ncbi:M28 family peptidase [Cardinium endosymbiont of Sogatella furcifera]|uniref:M28 family peptidase n=1 Tax=Cardinium endosymbiont of Sogatella furcifera TaxID=650378 RepID=UPI0013B408D1|nr:M28 family peptidase [Cardinium endosymbiont of Sogatella furcifera]
MRNSKVCRPYLSFATLCMGCMGIILKFVPLAHGACINPPVQTGTTISRMSDAALKKNLQRHIAYLSETIGPRNIENQVCYQKLCQAARYIDHAFKEIGYQPNITTYRATYNHQKFDVQNIEVVIPGNTSIPNGMDTKNSTPCIVIGAHYDTVYGTPGADDNGSGIALLIEIARHMYELCTQLEDKTKIKCTIKLVAFPNEEAPYSLDVQTGKPFGSNMGSVQYAKQAKEKGEVIIGMVSLESISYFSNKPGSQIYPWYLKWLKYFYGEQGNFLIMLGDLQSRAFQKKWIACYNQVRSEPFPMHPIVLPGWMPNVYRSDHGSFALEGFPACMITDTANLRNPNYHQATDTIATIDFNHFTQAAQNVIETVVHLALDDPST